MSNSGTNPSGGRQKTLGPRSLERPTDAGASLVAVLDHPTPFLVDGAGLVQPPGATWSLDWWIGADDRWYGPSREPTVRQRRRGSGPVLDTSIRVPSGDVTQTVFATTSGGRQVAVVEVANQSPVPVALSLSIRPYNYLGVGSEPSMRWVSDRELDVDGVRLILPRPPSERAWSGADDLWDTVGSGAGLVWPDQSIVGGPDARFVNGLIMFPLPHGTSLRVCLVPAGSDSVVASTVDPAVASTVAIDTLPEADSVANGWNTIVETGGRFEFPDTGLTEMAAAARARLLLVDPDLGHNLAARIERGGSAGLLRRVLRRADSERRAVLGDEPEILVALAESGHHEHLVHWLRSIGGTLMVAALTDDEPEPVAAFVGAIARSAVLVDPPTADAVGPSANDGQMVGEMLLESLARLTKQLESSNTEATTTTVWEPAAEGLLILLHHLGQVEAAADLRHRLLNEGVGHQDGDVAPLVDSADLAELAQLAHSSGRWASGTLASDPIGGPQPDSASDAAAFWRLARGRMLQEVVQAAEPTIELLPGFPTSWRGGPVEVHEASTLYGSLSFAIRWHGARPALLWDQGNGNTRLLCSSLDPDWHTTESRGETLLAGTADGLDDTPAPGDSFI